ncbi:hypothetical protein SM007_37035 [Streptomyces avermitilis]|uniref:Uncharacterized protein n=1 Tax=Streptomyces avermitilis TaxID=33903 RepID=A0A4D4MHF0_STRAX|nr:hypothetical protein [Streptomyces avermitilis]OOV17993.1 hypothetical protein SM007_37035 [Streptomyces avermitilis]GDY68492.1 hypothetical protein SAV14893_078850 [Streptomyces avermitilis]GDY71134.1 hypothetical protein SAV31267_006190 [Streptomyces avermitilis]
MEGTGHPQSHGALPGARFSPYHPPQKEEWTTRVVIQAVSDRLLEKVAPKAEASAVGCWQYKCIRYSGCTRKEAYWAYGPCHDREPRLGLP